MGYLDPKEHDPVFNASTDSRHYPERNTTEESTTEEEPIKYNFAPGESPFAQIKTNDPGETLHDKTEEGIKTDDNKVDGHSTDDSHSTNKKYTSDPTPLKRKPGRKIIKREKPTQEVVISKEERGGKRRRKRKSTKNRSSHQ